MWLLRKITCHTGQLVVASLLERNIKARLILRDPQKASSLFGNQDEEKLQVQFQFLSLFTNATRNKWMFSEQLLTFLLWDNISMKSLFQRFLFPYDPLKFIGCQRWHQEFFGSRSFNIWGLCILCNPAFFFPLPPLVEILNLFQNFVKT